VLLYPVTFLISDLVTEFYGKDAAKHMIITAVICSITVTGLLMISDYCKSTDWSIVDDETFHKVFNAYGIGTIASIIATFFGQLIDVYIFLYFKKLTDSKHLWLRNNVSTIAGQLVDTILVLLILCNFEIIPWAQFSVVLASSFAFKFLAALADTPFCYLGHYVIRKYQKRA
jgi:uncharacterized integral membrane protein (TIGR00697 family)